MSKNYKRKCENLLDWKKIEAEYSQLSISDPQLYDNFIKEAALRSAKAKKKESSDLYTEVHHVVPRHAGGTDEPENLVLLLYEDHIKAHLIRWVVYGDQKDFLAFRWMSGETGDIRRERAQLGGQTGGLVTQANNKNWD